MKKGKALIASAVLTWGIVAIGLGLVRGITKCEEVTDVNGPDWDYYHTTKTLRATHRCPVHGEIGKGWSYDIMNIAIKLADTDVSYECCSTCAYLYLIEVLKENIPQITRIEPNEP